MAADAKRRRIVELAGLHGISQRALAALTQELVADEGQLTLSRGDTSRALNKEFNHLFGEVEVPLSSGGFFKWVVLEPGLVLQALVADEPNFKALMGRVAERATAQEGGEVTMLWYADEVTPGNALRPDNRRKSMAWYFSFAEVGPEDLSQCHAWTAFAIMRHAIAANVDGGYSHVSKLLLRHVADAAVNLFHGVALRLEPHPQLLRTGKVDQLLDGDAQRSIWSTKGASGLKTCLHCRNVFSKHSDLEDDYVVTISCADQKRFDPCTDADVWAQWDKLAAEKPRLSAKEFDAQSKACGLNYNVHGLLGDVRLRSIVRPVSGNSNDWMHAVMANGVANLEVHHILRAMQR